MELENWGDYLKYDLPEQLIAQRPLAVRGESRMLVLNNSLSPEKNKFFGEIKSGDLSTLLNCDDLLILNNTGVTKCRVIFDELGLDDIVLKRNGEFFYLREGSCFPQINSLFKQRKWLRQGQILTLKNKLKLRVINFLNEKVVFEVISPTNEDEFEFFLDQYGVVPIPPYIRKGHADAQDLINYQTSFSNDKLSIAAPTAGFHFDENCLDRIKKKGVKIEYLTVSLGLWSIRAFDGPKPENFFISENLYQKIQSCRGKIVAVGTSTVRALETLGIQGSSVVQKWTSTDLIIREGHKFKIVDRMVTNFHQPGSTHLMLVCAFFGINNTLEAYEYAKKAGFRFLSYGDCMLIDKA